METKKEKGKGQQEEFDTTPNDDLDQLDLMGWAWEFEKRNPDGDQEISWAGMMWPKNETFVIDDHLVVDGVKDKSRALPGGFLLVDGEIMNWPFKHTFFVRSSSTCKLRCQMGPGKAVSDPSSRITVAGCKIKGAAWIKRPKYQKLYKRLYFRVPFGQTENGPEKMLKEEKNPFTVMFLVNVSGSAHVILSEFKMQLRAWQKELKQQLKMPSLRRRKEWKIQVMVYDLKEKFHKDYEEMAAILYPKEKNDYPNFPVTKRLRKAYGRAKKMIKGEYKKYIPEIPPAAYQ